MAYTKTIWENSPSENTPISAENLNNIENGISGVDTRLTNVFNGNEPMGSIVVSDIRSKNMFNSFDIVSGNIDGSGNVVSASYTTISNITKNSITFSTTEVWKGFTSSFIKAKSLEKYIISFSYSSTNAGIINAYMKCYDSNKTFLGSGTKSNNVWTALANTAYVRIMFQNDKIATATVSNIMLEQNSIATDYSEYIGFGRTDIFTGQECPTNEYVDGKQKFVKRINFGILPNNTSKFFDTSIPSNYTIEKIEGTMRSASKATMSLPYTSTTGFIRTSIWLNGEQYRLEVLSTYDASTYNAYFDIYYTKD
jgi:hypothetical protein